MHCYSSRPHMSCAGLSSALLRLEPLWPPRAAPVPRSGTGLGSRGSRQPLPGGRDTLPAVQVALWPWGGGTGVSVPAWGAGAPADGHEDVAPAGTAAVRPRACTWVLPPPLGANRGLRGGQSGWGCSQSPKGIVHGTRQDVPEHLPCAGQRELRSPGKGLQGTNTQVRTLRPVPRRNNARGIAEIQCSEGGGHGGCN